MKIKRKFCIRKKSGGGRNYSAPAPRTDRKLHFLESMNANERNRKPHRNPANPITQNTKRSREPATQPRGERAPESGTRRTTAAPPPQIKSQRKPASTTTAPPKTHSGARTASQEARQPGQPRARPSQPARPAGRPAENRASFLEKILKQKQNFFRSRTHAKHH